MVTYNFQYLLKGGWAMTLRSQPDLGTPLHRPGVDSNRGNELPFRKTSQLSGPDRSEEEEKDPEKVNLLS